MARLSIAEQVSHIVHFHPAPDARPLLEFLSGSLGVEAAREALVALSDGFPNQLWQLGQGGASFTNVGSVAEVCVEGNRFELLRDLVRAGPPLALADMLTPAELTPATSGSAWLERLTRSRVPPYERLEDDPEFTQTSLVELASSPRFPRALDFLALALEHHPQHPDIDALLRERPPEHVALLRTALMRHGIAMAQTSPQAAPTSPRRARAL